MRQNGWFVCAYFEAKSTVLLPFHLSNDLQFLVNWLLRFQSALYNVSSEAQLCICPTTETFHEALNPNPNPNLSKHSCVVEYVPATRLNSLAKHWGHYVTKNVTCTTGVIGALIGVYGEGREKENCLFFFPLTGLMHCAKNSKEHPNNTCCQAEMNEQYFCYPNTVIWWWICFWSSLKNFWSSLHKNGK